MIKTILVDDEIGNRELMVNMLKDFPIIEIVGEASNVEQAYELVCKYKPDLVLLDIQMPRANGFNLLKKFETVPFEVVFVTSYDKYAINAIKFNALDYLLKPLDYESLEFAIKKVEHSLHKKLSNAAQIVNLLNNLDDLSIEQRIAVHSGEFVKILNVSEIIYIEAERRYCHIYANSGEKYMLARNINEFEDYLGSGSVFIRISRSIILNINYIKSYSKGEPFFIIMSNGKSFEIPRRKKAEIREKLFDKPF